MASVKEEIVLSLKKITEGLTDQEIVPQLEHPAEEPHGDYSSNIALTLFGKVSKGAKVSEASKGYKSPMELAEKIVRKINSLRPTFNFLDKVEAVKPGFINFFLSQDYLASLIKEAIRLEGEYGSSSKLKNKKIMLEFADPNPFKEFHIGHLRNITLGESYARLLESQKALVWRVNYQGDVGLHVAKTLYGIKNYELRIMNYETKSLAEKVKLLGQAYAFGTKAYEGDESAKKEIEKINKEVYEGNSSVMDIYKKGRKWSLEYFDSIYKRLGTKFKRFYFESEAGKKGLEIVKKNIGNVFKKSQGAVIFPGEKYSLHNRVFINSLGLPTYEAKDMALAPIKYKDFSYDKSIIITGQEQAPYFKVVLAAMKLVSPSLSSKTVHNSFGLVSLSDAKMSSRLGNIVTGEFLLDEAKARITKVFQEMDEETAEKVAVGAVKYSMLKLSKESNISFSFDESISLEGNSGPYLQYTFARTQSVLAKAGIRNYELRIKNIKLETEEVLLLRSLHRFSEVVEEAGSKFAPNLLCNYLFDLAQKFNLFYQKFKIIGSEKQNFRLKLTKAVGQIIKNGLYLLGISAPEKI